MTTTIEPRSETGTVLREQARLSSQGMRVDAAEQTPAQQDLFRVVASALLEDTDSDSGSEGCSRLVNLLHERLNVAVLLVAFDPLHKRFSLVADSQGRERPRQLSPGEPLEQALSEARLLQLAPATGTYGETPILKQLAVQLRFESAATVLLLDREGVLQGALVLSGSLSAVNAILSEKHLVSISTSLAKYLRLRRLAEETTWQKGRRQLTEFVAARRLRVLGGLLTLAGLVLLIPLPFHVKATCQCEPQKSRIVVAPFEGRLLTAYVKPGDQVVAGQPLAMLDGSELRAQLAGTTAKLNQARQRYSAAIATGNASSAGEQQLEVEHLRQQLKVLDQRQQRLELRSPIDGIVVSGDLERATGASLVIGQSLFEVAPLEKLNAEIAIDESDIQHVAVGQDVSLTFGGSFGQTYQAKIDRIHPRGETREDKNVFLAEATLLDTPGRLAPGMQGSAAVSSGWRSCGWILFRKPYLAWCRWWGWY